VDDRRAEALGGAFEQVALEPALVVAGLGDDHDLVGAVLAQRVPDGQGRIGVADPASRLQPGAAQGIEGGLEPLPCLGNRVVDVPHCVLERGVGERWGDHQQLVLIAFQLGPDPADRLLFDDRRRGD
jgi:hypothetical protein